MAADSQKLSRRIRDALEQEKLPRNCIIYFDDEHGWVHRKGNDTFIDSIPTFIEQTRHTNLVDDTRPLENLGPFGTKPTRISLNIIEDTNMYQIMLNGDFDGLNITNTIGQHAPIIPITLTGRARDVACIPEGATHFCWTYPLIGLTQASRRTKGKINQAIADGHLEYTFLSLGGFVYFRIARGSYKMLQANCLVQADNGLTFQGPFPWRSAYTANLARQGRFQSVTIASLLDLGIKYYCFINPNEKLTSSSNEMSEWIPACNGGFIYLYDSKLESHKYDRFFCITSKPLKEQLSTDVMPFSLLQQRKKSDRPFTAQNLPDTSSSITSEIEDNFRCSICLERRVKCIFIPCKHMCTCSECAQEIRQRLNSVCPMCRKIFTEVWDVFL